MARNNSDYYVIFLLDLLMFVHSKSLNVALADESFWFCSEQIKLVLYFNLNIFSHCNSTHVEMVPALSDSSKSDS